MGDQTKKQLLEELITVQKMFEERKKTQGHMIRKLQTLIAYEGLFSQIIDFFPYPLAIFTPQYALTMTNKAFAAEIKTRSMTQEKGVVRILQHKIDDMRLAAAVTRVFSGDTFFLKDLKNPFSMFAGISQHNATKLDRFHEATIFPVPADNTEITHGVIVFMSSQKAIQAPSE